MANKYTKTPNPNKSILEKLYYERFMSQKEIGEVFNVSQKIVWRWFRDLGIKSRVAYKRFQKGTNNDSWKGDDATYAAFHYRVESVRGKPKKCSVCHTTKKKKYNWANISGKYQDVNDYARMCISCHRKYDKNRPNSMAHVRTHKK